MALCTSLPSRSRAYGKGLRGSLCPSKSVKVRTDRLESAGLRGTPLASARRPPSSSNGLSDRQTRRKGVSHLSTCVCASLRVIPHSASSPWRPEGADTIILNLQMHTPRCSRIAHAFLYRPALFACSRRQLSKRLFQDNIEGEKRRVKAPHDDTRPLEWQDVGQSTPDNGTASLT